jgi:hypothetical protein
MSDISAAEVTIYALTDPDTGEVRYVGKAKNAQRRYAEHLADYGVSLKAEWIGSLSEQQRVPVLKILEEHLTADEAKARELWWIEHYRTQETPLVNCLDRSKNAFRLRNHAQDRKKPELLSSTKIHKKKWRLTVAVGLRELAPRYGVFTSAELARRLGLSRQHAWQLWAGRSLPSQQTMQKLHDELSIPFELLAELERAPRKGGRNK